MLNVLCNEWFLVKCLQGAYLWLNFVHGNIVQKYSLFLVNGAAKKAFMNEKWVVKNAEATNQKTRELRPLFVGSRCLLQDQGVAHTRKWNSCGVGMDVIPHDKFVVRIDAEKQKVFKVVQLSLNKYRNESFPWLAQKTIQITWWQCTSLAFLIVL